MNLGGGQGTESGSMPSSIVSWKSGAGAVSDHFPAGLRVLVVDDDPTCLMILEKMLRTCRYEATKCNRAEVALSLLRDNKNGFDVVISDVHMPDMDGFKLLEHIGLEMDLPVIMMSADDSKNVVMKGVTHGACDYLIKPVRIEALKNIWQHVVRKRKHEWKDLEQSGSVDDGKRQQKPSVDADYSSSANESNCRNSNRKKDEAEDRDDTSSLKKPRVVWSVELHQQFVAAANQLGIDKAVPKKILELMNVPGLTRENVASHLQKYRLYLRRLSGQHQSGLNSSFLGTPDATFGSISSLNDLDLQAYAATGQLPAQSLATFQAAALGTLGRSTTKSSISPLVDQTNIFSFETPKLRFGEGQQPQLNNNSKQMNFLHGIPTNMEPKQLASLHQTAHSFGGMNMQLMQVNSHGSQSNSIMAQMAKPQSRAPIHNDTIGSYVSRLPSSVGQPILSNGITSGVLAQNGLVDNVRGPVYNQASSMVDFSVNHNTDMSGNSFRLGGNSGISSLASKGVIQEQACMEMKGTRGGTSYDIFNDLHQHKSQDWGLQNVGLTFDASQHENMQGSLEALSSVLVQQGFSSSQTTGHNRNSSIGKGMFSVGEESGHRNTPNIGQQLNAYFTNNLPRVKAERLPEGSYQNTLLPEQHVSAKSMSRPTRHVCCGLVADVDPGKWLPPFLLLLLLLLLILMYGVS